MSNNYKFSVDWTSTNAPTWYRELEKYKDQPNINFLEIGCFQGRSTVWLLENILTHQSSTITCVDTFEGSIEHHTEAIYQDMIPTLYETFCHNTSYFEDKVIIKRNKSQDVLKELNDKKEYYDFIYIDGDHHAAAVLEDAVLAFPLLKHNGILIFDDYHWGAHMVNGKLNLDVPRPAIDAFLSIYANKIEVIGTGGQIMLRKL
jgi:predicted O-methyltransferase YrrM